MAISAKPVRGVIRSAISNLGGVGRIGLAKARIGIGRLRIRGDAMVSDLDPSGMRVHIIPRGVVFPIVDTPIGISDAAVAIVGVIIRGILKRIISRRPYQPTTRGRRAMPIIYVSRDGGRMVSYVPSSSLLDVFPAIVRISVRVFHRVGVDGLRVSGRDLVHPAMGDDILIDHPILPFACVSVRHRHVGIRIYFMVSSDLTRGISTMGMPNGVLRVGVTITYLAVS